MSAALVILNIIRIFCTRVLMQPDVTPKLCAVPVHNFAATSDENAGSVSADYVWMETRARIVVTTS